MASLVSVLSYFSIICISVILPITCIFCGYMFYKYKHKQYFVKRNKTLLITICCGFTINIYTQLLPGVLWNGFDISYFTKYEHNFYFVALLFAIVSVPFIVLTLFRYFDLLIRIMHTESSKKWRLLLTSSNTQTNFILKHYNKFSRPKYQFLLSFILYIIILILFLSCSSTGDMHDMIIAIAIMWLLFAIFVAICLYKIGQFADFWYIRFELWLMVIVLLFGVIILAIIIPTLDDLPSKLAVIFALESFSTPIVFFLFVCFPIFMNERRDKQIEQRLKESNMNSVQKLYALMCDTNGYEALMDHLEKEFAVENLLYLTEIIQFRDYLTAKDNTFFENDNVTNLFGNKNINLPSDIPKSIIIPDIEENDDELNSPNTTIVWSSNDYETEYNIFMALYKKYIDKYEAQLEINISYSINLSLKKCYDELVIQMSDEADNISRVNSQTATDVDFIAIWNNLVKAAREITSILNGSAQRCRYNIVDMKFM
eukprot:485896_1